jgi:hypothetical protein
MITGWKAVASVRPPQRGERFTISRLHARPSALKEVRMSDRDHNTRQQTDADTDEIATGADPTVGPFSPLPLGGTATHALGNAEQDEDDEDKDSAMPDLAPGEGEK